MSSRARRSINALFWIAAYAGIVVWTETWGRWVPMFFEAWVPVMLWGYLHLVLGRTGTSMQ